MGPSHRRRLLVGDGSGSKTDSPFGWASCLVERQTGGRQLFYGGLSCGTINIAELLPYVHALDWYEINIAGSRPSTRGYRNVHILTDSQTVARWINRANAGQSHHYFRPYIVMLEGFRKLGYAMHAHWIERQTSLLHNVTDLVSVDSRKQLEAAAANIQKRGDETGVPYSHLANEIRSLFDLVDRTPGGVNLHHLEPYSAVPAQEV